MANEHQSKFNYSMFNFSRGFIWGVDKVLYLSVQGRARGEREREGGSLLAGDDPESRQLVSAVARSQLTL